MNRPNSNTLFQIEHVHKEDIPDMPENQIIHLNKAEFLTSISILALIVSGRLA